nr:MAG TPA: helix-turn-helix domain protein [Caudoviricetes sp.]
MKKLKQIREKKAISQPMLANLMGVSQQTISYWENGTYFPRADKLTHIAQILDCSVDELLK